MPPFSRSRGRCSRRRAFAAELPARLDPPAPFPAILSQAPTVETIAPGIGYAEYALVTADGPVVVRVVAIAPHRSDVRIEPIAAHDRLTSSGETVSSMAARTGAVAGVNGDYYDIGSTNRPTNVLIRDGRILHTPNGRYALVIDRSGNAAFSHSSSPAKSRSRTTPLRSTPSTRCLRLTAASRWSRRSSVASPPRKTSRWSASRCSTARRRSPGFAPRSRSTTCKRNRPGIIWPLVRRHTDPTACPTREP